MEYRQNSIDPYKGDNGDTEDVPDEESHGGNTGLPFGLCKKYGISLPQGATPRDAWDALAGRGIYPPWTEKGKDQYKDKSGKEDGEESEPQQTEEESEKAIDRMLSDSRIIYDKKITKDYILNSLNAGTAEMRDLTVRLFNEDSFGYSNAYSKDTAYFPGANKVSFYKTKNVGGEEFDSSYEKGATFFHETWHAIDSNYGEVVDTKYMSGYQKRHLTLSETHILRNGKTFESVLFEECKNVNWGDAIKEVKTDKENALQKLGLSYDKCVDEYRAVLNKEMELRRKAGYGTSPELRAYIKSKEYQEAKKNYAKAEGYPPEVNRKWGDLSDIACGYTKGRQQLTNMGHSGNYFKEKGQRASEAFAECAAAMATNGESYQVLKRFVPNTMAAFEEIYQDLKNGEIKSNGRQRYVP